MNYPFFISNLLINGKQIKLVNADTIINGCNPIFGKRKAPDNDEVVPAKFEIEQSNAKLVASLPEIVDFAIKLITIKCTNIPNIANKIPYKTAVTGVK
jgi:hypothetical protein